MEGKVTLDRSALAYLVGSIAVVASLAAVVMRGNVTSTETVLALLRDRSELQAREDALQARRIDSLQEEVTALRARMTSNEAKLLNAEARVMRLETEK